MFHSLLRTIPSLSGNVKIACSLSDYIKTSVIEQSKNIDYFDCYVRYAKLLPISSSLYQKNIKANLLGSTYDYDLKTFFQYYNDVFYKSCFNIDKKDFIKIDKTKSQYQRNTDFEFGVKRVSYVKNNAQFAFFAPIYIESVDDIPESFVINCKFTSKIFSVTKKIRINIKRNNKYKGNYLYQYLYKYVSKIDDNVIWMTPSSKQATYYGIDLVNGGLVKGSDNIISKLYTKQNTINEFDACINYGFKRNNMAIRQILPLCFLFNPYILLTSLEKTQYTNAKIDFSGYYIDGDGNQKSLYDFYIDYDKFTQDIYQFNSNTGYMNWINGEVANIMDVSFPSLHEKRIMDYQYANKLTPMYNRWKLKWSDNNHPYITNISWAFSKNQDSNYNYGQFLNKYYQINSVCNIIKVNNKNKYNLIFPIGDTYKNIYKQYNSNIITDYESIMNKYCLNWFETSNLKGSWWKNINWADVVDNYVFYNGVLYNINNIYSTLVDGYEKIDKFAIIVHPIFNTLNNNEINKLNTTNYTLLHDTSNVTIQNCLMNNNVITWQNGSFAEANLSQDDDYDTNDEKENIVNNNKFTYTKEWYNYLFGNEMSYSTNIHQITTNNIYSHALSIAYEIGGDIESNLQNIISSYNCNYTRLSYLNIDYNKVNKYYTSKDVQEVNDILENIDRESIIDYVSSYIKNPNLNYINNANETILNSNYIKNLIDNSIVGYSLLPIHTLSIFETYNYNSNLSYIKLDDNRSYISNCYIYVTYNSKYNFNIYYNGNNDGNICPVYDDYGQKQTVYLPLISIDQFNKELGLPLKDNTNTYIYVSYGYQEVDSAPTQFSKKYIDPIYSCLYVSNSSKYDKINVLYNYEGNDYIKLSYDSINPNIMYNLSLYSRNNFIKASDINYFAYNDFTNTYTYLYKDYITYIQKYLSLEINKKLQDKDEYEFLPCVFNLNNQYTNNVFKIRTSGSKSFYGNIIEKKNIDNDRDVIWVDIYNLQNVFSEYGIYINKKYFEDKIWHTYCKFLNKLHLYYWYFQIHKNAQGEDEITDFNKIWYNYIYLRYRVLLNEDNKNNIKVKDKLIPLSQIESLIDNVKLNTFNNFYRSLVYNKSNGMFYINDHEDKLFELVFEHDLIRLNQIIYEKILNIDETISSSDYKDLYLYTIENIEDFEERAKIIDNYPKIKYENLVTDNISDNIKYVDIDNILTPLFSNIYVQQKENEQIFVYYELHNISQVSIIENNELIDKNYRFESNNIDYMIDITEDEKSLYTTDINGKQVWEYLTGRKFESILYYPYQSTSIDINNSSTEYNDLNYYTEGSTNRMSTFKDLETGTNYGFYLINLKFDNTMNSFNLTGIEEYESDGEIKYNNILNIKSIEYINSHNILENKDWVINNIKLLMPFISCSVTDVLPYITSLVKPITFNIESTWKEQLINSTNKSNEISLINEDLKTKQTLLRYLEAIKPCFHKVSKVTNQYNLKFKDVSKTMINEGKYNSIGDSVIYDDDLLINKYHPLNVYTHNNNYYDNNSKLFNIDDWNNLSFTFTPLEYKHYNCSVGINLSPSLCKKLVKKYTYEELLELESNENTFKVFKSCIKNQSRFSEDELIFLYNRYEHSYSTICVGLNSSLTEKLYTIEYIFNLY